MTWPVYSKRFLLFTNLQGDQVVTVPVGKVWVITDISAVSRVGAAGDAYYVAIAGCIFTSFRLGSAGVFSGGHWSGRQVALAGQPLDFGTLQGKWDGAVSGYELDG